MADRMTDEEFERVLAAWEGPDAGYVSGVPNGPRCSAFAARVRELQARITHMESLDRCLIEIQEREISRLRARRAVLCETCDGECGHTDEGVFRQCPDCHGTGATWKDDQT
jgi:DnaJ-class molecular chaperone